MLCYDFHIISTSFLFYYVNWNKKLTTISCVCVSLYVLTLICSFVQFRLFTIFMRLGCIDLLQYVPAQVPSISPEKQKQNRAQWLWLMNDDGSFCSIDSSERHRLRNKFISNPPIKLLSIFDYLFLIEFNLNLNSTMSTVSVALTIHDDTDRYSIEIDAQLSIRDW